MLGLLETYIFNMSFKGPTYVPREGQTSSIGKFWLLGLALLLILASAVFVMIYWPKPQLQEKYSTIQLCDFSLSKQQDRLLINSEPAPIMVDDYFFYGESLNLLSQPYKVGIKDDFTGRTIQLENICNGNIYSFLMGDYLDQKIPLTDLEEGFYRFFIQENLSTRLLLASHDIHDQRQLVRRHGQAVQLDLVADQKLFDNIHTGQPLFKNRPLFLRVQKVPAKNDVVDLVLDPAYNNQDFGPIQKGYQEQGFDASLKTYQFSQRVKEELEKKGLNVAITRPNQQLVVNTYGDVGRVHKALSTGAKYMVEFYFESVADTSRQGSSAYGSAYVSLNFQESLMRMVATHQLPIFIGQRGQKGAFHNPIRLEDGLDQNNLVRESGGLALGAGRFSLASERLNEFAKENRHGVHTISMNLLMTSHPDFVRQFDQVKDDLVKATVEGILSYLQIEDDQ